MHTIFNGRPRSVNRDFGAGVQPEPQGPRPTYHRSPQYTATDAAWWSGYTLGADWDVDEDAVPSPRLSTAERKAWHAGFAVGRRELLEHAQAVAAH